MSEEPTGDQAEEPTVTKLLLSKLDEIFEPRKRKRGEPGRVLRPDFWPKTWAKQRREPGRPRD